MTALKMWKEEFCGRDLKDSPDIFYLACTGSDVVRYEIDEPMALYGAIPMIWAIHRLEGNWRIGVEGESGGVLFRFRGDEVLRNQHLEHNKRSVFSKPTLRASPGGQTVSSGFLWINPSERKG